MMEMMETRRRKALQKNNLLKGPHQLHTVQEEALQEEAPQVGRRAALLREVDDAQIGLIKRNYGANWIY